MLQHGYPPDLRCPCRRNIEGGYRYCSTVRQKNQVRRGISRGIAESEKGTGREKRFTTHGCVEKRRRRGRKYGGRRRPFAKRPGENPIGRCGGIVNGRGQACGGSGEERTVGGRIGEKEKCGGSLKPPHFIRSFPPVGKNIQFRRLHTPSGIPLVRFLSALRSRCRHASAAFIC